MIILLYTFNRNFSLPRERLCQNCVVCRKKCQCAINPHYHQPVLPDGRSNSPHLVTLIFNTKGRKRGISISGNFVFWHTSRVVSRPSIFLGKIIIIIIILHDVIMVDDVVVRFTSYVVNLQRTSFRRRELRKRYANRRTSEDGTLVAKARARRGRGKSLGILPLSLVCYCLVLLILLCNYCYYFDLV